MIGKPLRLLALVLLCCALAGCAAGTPGGGAGDTSAQGGTTGTGDTSAQGSTTGTGDTSAQGSTAGAPPAAPDQSGMSVSSSGIGNGVIADKYGMRGSQKDGDTPTLSIPITVENAPDGTVCYALRMTDPDSIATNGFEWVHWIAVNIMTADLPENASIDLASEMVQGMNDFNAIGYGGPTPPGSPHTYVITVYALDSAIDLQNGFAKDAFDTAIGGHVLEAAQIQGVY